jgi:hypothetical protein
VRAEIRKPASSNGTKRAAKYNNLNSDMGSLHSIWQGLTRHASIAAVDNQGAEPGSDFEPDSH